MGGRDDASDFPTVAQALPEVFRYGERVLIEAIFVGGEAPQVARTTASFVRVATPLSAKSFQQLLVRADQVHRMPR